MQVYTAKDVAKLLDLSVHQIRSYARAGFLHPERGSRGEYRFSFQDLVLLRTAKGLLAARIPAQKVRRALRRLKDQLPTDKPLTGVKIRTDGDRVLVHDGDSIWNPESGQGLLNFEVADLAKEVAPHSRKVAEQALETDEELSVDEWHTLGSDLEPMSPDQAREAYRRALELNPYHTDSRVNLGRLLHEQKLYASADAHYRMALSVRPEDVTALFNLGVCLEDQGKTNEAVQAYRNAIAADPACADAHYNIARLYENLGREPDALRHLRTYRKLTKTL